MLMCKSIEYIYYCEELFVVKHKSKHSCASAIFYELGPQQVIKNYRFDYMYNVMVPPVIYLRWRKRCTFGKLQWAKVIEMYFNKWWIS